MIRLPHLETDFTQACQLSCRSCNHHVPLWRGIKGGPWATTPAQVEADLGHLAGFLHADRWGALGGEPTLHHQVIDLLKIARASGIADKTEVWTNGISIQRMKPDFWRAFDILVVSIYPGKLTDADLDWMRRKCADVGVELVEKDERRFPNFKTLFEPTPTDPETTREKFRGCFFRSFSRVANYGWFFTCCCAPHMPMLMQGQPFGTDGIEIAGSTEADIRAYLERSEPLGACTICAGRDTAVSHPWSEERSPLAWITKSAEVQE